VRESTRASKKEREGERKGGRCEAGTCMQVVQKHTHTRAHNYTCKRFRHHPQIHVYKYVPSNPKMNMYIFIHTCMHIYLCVRVCGCICIYVNSGGYFINTHNHTLSSGDSCISARATKMARRGDALIHACMCTCIYIYTHIYIRIYISAYIYTYI